MEPYAVVETGGRQFLVKEGDTLRVNRISADKGEKVEIDTVCALSDGKELKLGTPEIAGAKVVCLVLEHVRDSKVISFKKKRRKGYSRKVGHRQDLTVLKVEALGS